MRAQKPNILIFFTDMQRADTISKTDLSEVEHDGIDLAETASGNTDREFGFSYRIITAMK